ncbi:MAG: DUF5103 domain-containing protein, partial [Bacteroidales bacterium]
YVVKVYDYDHSDQPLATGCFSVSEECVRVGATVSGITLKDYKKSNQQLRIAVHPDKLNVRSPQSELKLIVQQNGRMDNEQLITHPVYIGNNEIVYENNPTLTFAGGNEFRRFEMTTHKYSGMGIESVSFEKPYYHVVLQPDGVRAGKSYRYDQDQNGKYIVRTLEGEDGATEADYFMTHFYLDLDDPLINGKIYLFGELSNYLLDERFELSYDASLRGYVSSQLLKQGLYNYQYLYVPNNKLAGQTGFVEGDYYETQNEYSIKVYYRAPGDRYDRLVASYVVN